MHSGALALNTTVAEWAARPAGTRCGCGGLAGANGAVHKAMAITAVLTVEERHVPLMEADRWLAFRWRALCAALVPGVFAEQAQQRVLRLVERLPGGP